MRFLEADASEVTVALTRDDLVLLTNSIGEALEAVEDWEFSTRLGFEPDQAKALRAALSDALKMHPPS